METKNELNFFSLTLIISLVHLSSSAKFTPIDNYLLNCGSSTNTTSLDGRVFVGDSSKLGSVHLSTGKSISVTTHNPNPLNLSHTARVFTTPSKYKFIIKSRGGVHLVRFHFTPFIAQSYDLSSAKFSVLAGGFWLLRGFSVNHTVIKEFVLRIDDGDFEIMFSPNGGRHKGFGFVNGIEVFSAPQDFVIDNGAKLITSSGEEEFKNLSSHILETIHRVNVGGVKLTPFNDTLWRTWIPDDDFLVLKSAAKRANTTLPPNYQKGGASQEIAPDNVYMTAQELDKEHTTLNARFNITWDFPVGSRGVRHLVRLHFCDFVSLSLNQLLFDVYINEFSAYKDLDLSSLTFHVLSAPYYVDFVVDSGRSGVMRVSVGPSDLSSPSRINAILNGVEILKMINLEGLETWSRKKNTFILAGSIVGGVVVLCSAILALLLVIKCKVKKPKSSRESVGWTPLRTYGGSSLSRMSEGTIVTSPGPNGCHALKIPFADIQSATNNFDKKLIIGSGGFGMVYKGILKDNTKVAIKRGVPGSRQGLPEFQTEITILSKIRHLHLVSLVGYCEEQSEMILVYEYMEKGPLKTHLYGPKHHPPLSWKQRLEICICAARGIHYLHTGSAHGIIHRDIKSTNILLDENYVAKVADFGLSRSGPCLDETHVSTGVKGSFGYLDPEYFRRQQLTDKSDVYSFGVVLFEVLCARPALDPLLGREQVNLAEWALPWQKQGMLEQIIDPHLKGKIKLSSLKKFGETAEKCLADYGVDRPTMGDVLWNLEHTLLLQQSELSGEEHEDVTVHEQELPTPRIFPELLSRSLTTEEEEANANLDISTSKVFSQLLTNEGR